MHGFFAFQPDGRIVEVNEAACRLLGYSRAELLSLSMVQLEAKRGSPEMESRCQRILSAGNDRFATRLRCKDGHEVDVELSAGSQKGAKPLLFGFARDMTGASTRSNRFARARDVTASWPRPLPTLSSSWAET